MTTRDILEHRPEYDATLFTVDGERSEREVEAGIARLLARFETSPTRNVVIDISRAAYEDDLSETIARWALLASVLPKARVAIVYAAATEPQARAAVEALARSHHEAERFDALDPAFDWIARRGAAEPV